jgi:GT2 family glycosyltransferase
VIDVIIPVYEGAEQTRRCIQSVLLSSSREAVEIVVVDDSTPNPVIARYLDELAAAGAVTLLRNRSNEGFVRSVNRAMALHDDRDVVLLNSDSEVANDWVERICAAARSDASIATVTPFSNNATICSYPFEGWAGGVPGTLGLAALDRLFAETNRGKVLDLPTAVGFCMFISRSSLHRLGAFDEARFGRGYGEENDFCMRAGKAGLRNVLACDVFVFHEGAVSFMHDRHALMHAAANSLLEAHPEYGQVIQAFIRADPVLPVREAVDAARARRGVEEAACVLAERAEERSHMSATARELERLLAEREALVGRLEAGLAEATRLVAERSAALADLGRHLRQRDEEIGRLHAGLSHAEELAFARERELTRIRSFWLWRYFNFLMSRRSPARGADS